MFMSIATIVLKLCIVKVENSVNVQVPPFVKSGHNLLKITLIIILCKDMIYELI